MINFINKNLFKLTFLLLILAELLSFFGWMLPSFNAICFFVILILTLICSLVKLEYGIYILLAELFIGSKGYLFAVELDSVLISVRIGLFLVVLSVWLYRELTRMFTRINANDSVNSRLNWRELAFKKYYFALAIVILWGFVWGLIQGNNFGNIFLDFNNWVYFLLVFPVFEIAKNPFDKLRASNFIKNILSVLTACVLWVCIKSIILLYIFSHEFAWALPEVYKWVRDTLVGEITFAGGGFWRVFIQSQIYSLLLFFILLPLVKIQDTRYPPANRLEPQGDWRAGKIQKKINNQILKNSNNCSNYLLFIISLTTVILSWSRSFWVGLVAGILIYFFTLILQKIKFLDFLKINAKIVLVAIISFSIVFAVINLPPKTDGGSLASMLGKRATEMEAASSSRINQLKPLLLEIAKHPIIGSGFGTTVTYKSDDPRILGNYTTYAFEWGYLDMILKFGIVGLSIYLYLIFQILRRLIIFNDKTNQLKIGFGFALVALLIVNIFSPYLNHPLGIGFVILCGCLFYEK